MALNSSAHNHRLEGVGLLELLNTKQYDARYDRNELTEVPITEVKTATFQLERKNAGQLL